MQASTLHHPVQEDLLHFVQKCCCGTCVFGLWIFFCAKVFLYLADSFCRRFLMMPPRCCFVLFHRLLQRRRCKGTKDNTIVLPKGHHQATSTKGVFFFSFFQDCSFGNASFGGLISIFCGGDFLYWPLQLSPFPEKPIPWCWQTTCIKDCNNEWCSDF